MYTDYDSGIYLLEIFLHKPKKIDVGAMGIHIFPPGYYYYCGSAQKNLNARLERHSNREKNFHWHIDYLLAEGHLQDIHTWPVSAEGECKLADYLIDEVNGEVIAAGFGSSDCSCKTHLIYFPQPLEKDIFTDINFFNNKDD